MKVLRSVVSAAVSEIRTSRQVYILMNVAYYGLVICGMVVTAADPSLHETLMAAVGESLSEGPLAPVWDAYSAERVLQAAALTVGINLALGSFATITLPSLIVPFSGLLMAVVRALLWGVLFSPPSLTGIGLAEAAAGLSIVVLVFLEGQGYVLAALGAYRHGVAFLFPRSTDADGHLQGYWRGVKTQARIYVLVLVVLLIAALYEVVIAVFALPALLAP